MSPRHGAAGSEAASQFDRICGRDESIVGPSVETLMVTLLCGAGAVAGDGAAQGSKANVTPRPLSSCYCPVYHPDIAIQFHIPPPSCRKFTPCPTTR